MGWNLIVEFYGHVSEGFTRKLFCGTKRGDYDETWEAAVFVQDDCA